MSAPSLLYFILEADQTHDLWFMVAVKNDSLSLKWFWCGNNVFALCVTNNHHAYGTDGNEPIGMGVMNN